MGDLEYVGKIKGIKTLKQLIESGEVLPAVRLEKIKAEEEARKKAFADAAKAEEFHRKTKICTGKVEGRELWTRERFID